MANDASVTLGKFRLCLCRLTRDYEVVRVTPPISRCKVCRDSYLAELRPDDVRDALAYTVGRYSRKTEKVK